MQTFVPYDDFTAIATCLDYRRLGKQRVECMQILTALELGEGPWFNHPATQMWAGYEPALRRYMRTMIEEWVDRGYRNTIALPNCGGKPRMPDWWGGPIHSTHRAALLFKDPDHYGSFDWTEEPIINYYWPTKEKDNV